MSVTERLRVMLVEDEALAMRRLKGMLTSIEGVQIVATAANGREALDRISAAAPDIVFLDISMPGVDGFEFLKRLPEDVAPAIVFVTAFDRYALHAFEADAADFVVKPVDFDRVRAAIERARRNLEIRSSTARVAELQAIVHQLREHAPDVPVRRYERELWVQQRTEFLRVSLDSIDWLEAEKDYVRIHAGDRSYLTHDSITGLSERLDPALFLRVHRSAIVRLDRVSTIRRGAYGALEIILSNGCHVRVGRKFAAAVRDRVRSRGGT